jgi:hypothetical protein
MAKYEIINSVLGSKIKHKVRKLKYKCKCETCYGALKPFLKHILDERGFCLNCQTEERYNVYDFVNGKAVNTQKGGVGEQLETWQKFLEKGGA